jgi:hypothetical protein
MYILILQRLLLEAVFDIFYFPIWWYTGGALRAGRYCLALFLHGNLVLAPGLWLRNIFVPMYGQYDWQGRLISFVMRVIQIIARGIALIVWLAGCLGLFALWFIFPVVVVWSLIRSAQL